MIGAAIVPPITPMSHVRPFAVSVTVAAALTAACAPKRIPEPTPPRPTLVVLLPDTDTGRTGRARVSNEFGSVDLTKAGDAARITPASRPEPMRTMSDAEVARVFDPALAALPPAPRNFTLRFEFESDELTPQSRALVPEILSAVKAHPVPEVAVIGHTDTLGKADANVALGLKRAMTVQRLLVAAGIDASIIAVTSHGEVDPEVRTPDNRAESRNRRVEISVR